MYALDFAKVYSALGNSTKMMLEYINFVSQQPRQIDYVKSILQELILEKENQNILENQLINNLQKNPENHLYNDLLMWLYIQKKDYKSAFIQAKAIDRKSKNKSLSFSLGLTSLCTCLVIAIFSGFAIFKAGANHMMDSTRGSFKTLYAQTAPVWSKEIEVQQRTLNELQRHSVRGSIDSGILVDISELDISTLVKALARKEFSTVRSWVVENLDNDSNMIFRKIYEGLDDKLTGRSIPQLVLILADYQYKTAFVADQEINLLACMTQIMLECEFK